MIGSSLGPYKILEPLGAGGMGEVYVGEDTRLGRKVAVKVLPAQFAADAERLARFEQEARAAAALNHPHIAAVYDVGAHQPDDGSGTVHYIVQELLDGQTLRAALAQGPLALPKALALAAEIGEALAAAHGAGVVHRDLKPDNVFVTAAGHAKVLDFGLAKLTEGAAPGSQLSMSPTVLGTVAGQVMGTAGYMSPEQVNGAEIDHRADIFAFGCLLYEMVTGTRAFGGETVIDTLHAVTRTEPADLAARNPALPAELQRIDGKCLAKDPARRYQHADDLVVDLEALRVAVESGSVAPAAGRPPDAAATATPAIMPGGGAGAGAIQRPSWLSLAALAWALAATGYAAFLLLTGSAAPESPVARFDIPLTGMGSTAGSIGTVAVSPDGTKVVYRAGNDRNDLWLRELDSLDAVPIPGSASAEMPFFSPDSRTVAFFAGTHLEKVDLAAATGADDLAEIEPDGLRGGDWASDGSIILGRPETVAQRGLRRFDPSTREFEELTEPTQPLESHRFPQILPGGRSVLFTIESAANSTRSDKEIAVLALDTREITVLPMRGTYARYVASGHLLYVRRDSLLAIPFDLDSLQPTGPEVVIIRGLASEGDVGSANFAVSDTGVLAYLTATGAETRLALVSRDGKVETLHDDLKSLSAPRMSPDGRRIAVVVANSEAADIWTYEMERGTFDRFTSGGQSVSAEWSADGERILFQSNRGGLWQGWVELATGVGEPQVIDAGDQSIYDGIVWHPNGRTFAFGVAPGDIWTYTEGDAEPEPFTRTDFIEGLAAFSPDGEWIAFSSEEQAGTQVYVTAFPGPGRRWVASTDFGTEPRWSRDGSELFYRHGEEMMAVPFDAGSDPPVGLPKRLFRVASPAGAWNIQNYDVTPDGRFVMLVSGEDVEPPRLNVVLNWFGELERLAPPSNGR